MTKAVVKAVVDPNAARPDRKRYIIHEQMRSARVYYRKWDTQDLTRKLGALVVRTLACEAELAARPGDNEYMTPELREMLRLVANACLPSYEAGKRGRKTHAEP